MLKLPPPENDGLLVPDVGEWSSDKHYFLLRYVDAFTTAMKDKPWEGLHYIDLFAGSGIERLRTSGKLEWGSPLIAAQAQHHFGSLHLCELNKTKYEALKTRVDRIRPGSEVLHGDGNEKVRAIVEGIPDRALSLAFLDPYGLHLDYETLVCLSRKRVDMIIFFPDHIDALRNWKNLYFDDPDSNLDRVLGPGADWRSIRDGFPRERWPGELRKLYVKQIAKLGYQEDQFDYERISDASGHQFYLLIFCSKHPMGAKLWREVSRKKPDQQRTFKFDD